MNSSNPADWMGPVYDWMRAERIDKNGPVIVDAVIAGVGQVVRPTRETVVEVLETLTRAGALARQGSNYKVTEDGERRLYPGTDADHVRSVVADLINYMHQNDPVRVFKLQEYQSEIRQRLNPKEAKVVNTAIQILVSEGFWIPLGRDSYELS